MTYPRIELISRCLQSAARTATLMLAAAVAIAALSSIAQAHPAPSPRATTYGYGYDPVSRLQTLAQDLDGATTTKDETRTFGYSPASQMVSRNLSNALYSFAQVPSVTTNYMVNGLNQYTQLASTTTLIPSYDANGNMTSDGVSNYSYDVLNRMTVGKLVAMSYDPKGRLFQSVSGASGTTTTYLYDGDALVAEYDASGALRRRYVHGSGVDEPLVWYESAIVNTSTRRYFHADHQGSIIAVANGAGTTVETDTYDPYGLPASSNTSRFQYTGQIAVPDLGLYYYKARIYNPALGRFMQTDPIGYKDDLDLYSYVGNDPFNKTDPTGLATCADPDCKMSKIDAHPAGDKGPTITFKNDNPKGPSPDQPVTTATAKMVESAVIKSGVNSVNINSTTGGEHAPASRHAQGKAVDIDTVNGETVKSQGASTPVKALQEAFRNEPNSRENFGPMEQIKTLNRGGTPVPWPGVSEGHQNHLHESGQD